MKAVLFSVAGAETWRLTDGAEEKVAGVYQQRLGDITVDFLWRLAGRQPIEKEHGDGWSHTERPDVYVTKG